jgi:ribonuclease HI
MTEPLTLTIHIDGAARGNPGPAAYACILRADGQVLQEAKGYLGTATNNVAEYTALVKALELAAARQATSVHIYSDSELLVRQMNGAYQVRSELLQPLYQQAKRLARQFDAVQLTHIYREHNHEADRLCAEVLNAVTLSAPNPEAARGPRSTPAASPTWAHQGDRPPTRAEAEQLLHEAAQVWAQAGPEALRPQEVLDRLLRLLHERGFLHFPGEVPGRAP